MGNYATIAQVKAFKVQGVVAPLTGAYSDSEIEDEITIAEAVIEAICGDQFYDEAATYKFDGNGLTKLFFQPTVPFRLLSVTTVKDYDVDGSTVLYTYTEGTDFKVYDYYLETARSFAGDSPRRRFGSGGVWPKGQENIVIDGTWGRAAVPPEITRATILMALERMLPGFCELSPTDVVQASWDDFQITVKGEELVGQSTGFLQVDILLSRFINHVGMFQVVPNKKQTYDTPFVTD